MHASKKSIKTSIVFTVIIFISAQICGAQNTVNVDLFTYTLDFVQKKPSYNNATAEIKGIGKDVIVIKKVFDENGKKIKYGAYSWALTFDSVQYVNLGAMSEFTMNRKTFVKLDKFNDKYCIMYSMYDSTNTNGPRNYYGGGLTGIMTQALTELEEIWIDKKGCVRTIYMGQFKKVGDKERLSLYPFTRRNYSHWLGDFTGKGPMRTRDMNSVSFESAMLFLNEYFFKE